MGKCTMKKACELAIQKAVKHFSPELLKGLSEILFLDPMSHEQLRQTGCYEFYHVDLGIVVANERYFEILSELRINSKKLEAVVLYSFSLLSTYDKTSEKAGVVSYSILEEIKELPVLVGNYLVIAEFLKDNFSIALNLIVSSDDSYVDIHSPRYLIQFSAHNIETEHLEKILMFADDAGIKELKMLPLLLMHACQYHGKLCFLFGDDMFLKGRDAPAIASAEFFANEKVLGMNLIAGDFSKIPFGPGAVISSFSHITLEDKSSLTGKWFAEFRLVHVHGQTVCVCSSAEISKARSLFGHAFIVVGLHVAEVVKAMEKLCSPFLF
ncbi:hypothetical protein A4A49_24570 [Nicotiana attenuata]|uniref:Uncharacterized protein n=1 Tax=Nicotiana attenuata TaxID=49451 RepID=A0A314LDZ9_NICAT|nr:hypothetical protein A4A49_24570 [Nicotiana attenuata]